MTTRQTVEFPDITDSLWPTRLVEQLLNGNLIDTGGVQFGIRFGSATLTFTAAATSAAITITHGLGRAPAAILTGVTGTASRADVNATIVNLATTTFGAVGVLGNQAVVTTGTATFYWAVIG